MIFFIISCWLSLAVAISLDSPPRPTETLLIDPRIPVFVDGHWQIMSAEEHHELLRRKVDSSSADETVTTTIKIGATSTAKPTTTTAQASPLPSPFDGALAANFSGENNGACPQFINNFMSNSTFKSCYPFSLLLQGSQSFFKAEKSLVSITQVLEASCQADVDVCTNYLNKLATDLIADENCGPDYKLENSLIVQAYLGMKAYRPLYGASCLQDPDTSSYCFANAVTDLSTTSNVYVYYLPLNLTLPKAAEPTCNYCTSTTMSIFQAATSDRKSAIAYTFGSAASQVNSLCGTSFVNGTLSEPMTQGSLASSITAAPTPLLLLPLLIATISHWL